MSALDRLSRALHEDRFDEPATEALIEQCGPAGRLVRASALARRRRWTAARLDLQAVPEADPVHEFVAGTLLFVARDYAGALERIGRAASADDSPALALQAGELVIRLTGELGWLDEQRSAWSRLGRGLRLPAEVERKLASARARREQARRRRADELLADPPARAAERAFARLAIDGADAARESFADLHRRHGRVPELVIEHARLELALGRLDHAAALLDERDATSERFDAIRAALALARGDLEGTIVRTMHHRGDAWAMALRGEALELAGEFVEAAALLEQARAKVPSSVAIALKIALARERVDEAASVAIFHRFEQLLDAAPVLLADAARIVGVSLWTDQGPLVDRETIVAIVATARALLSPDRHLWAPSYRIGEGPLRMLAPASNESHSTRLHGGDADRRRIELAEATLFRALGFRPAPLPPPPSGPAIQVGPERARALRPDEVEQFLTEGYLVVRGAFDPRISAAWIADANRRIRDEPERWVKNYDPSDPAGDLSHYDPERPETWTWPRINLEGERSLAIEEFSPRGWAAICELLGGPERIKTRTWTNYLIANFNADAELDVPGPAPDWQSWHIDDPNPVTRLDRIANGLVGIAIHSRLLPRSGGTWLALDSVGHVARMLADHPEGVDFCSGRGVGVTRRCKRFFEVTGEVGDLLLMHPLMMHSCAPNPSGRIRWMGNPMVYLEQPLQPLRPHGELSPVELAIRRAIEPDTRHS
ncbi:hypothetical protein ACNOYE_02770 [Nannocystaceae bacterium ST9]